jgi:hypothetical protein
LLGHLPLGFSLVVMADVITDPHELQVLEPIVGSNFVDVVDDVSGRDWPVGVFPDPSMLELKGTIGSALCAASDVPAEHPISVLDVPLRSVSALPFVVGSTSLGAVEALDVGAVLVPFSPARSAHASHRLGSSSHPPIIGRWPDEIRVSSMLSAPVPYSSTVRARVPARGLRAITTGSYEGLSADPRAVGESSPTSSPTLRDFGKP